MRGDSLRRAAIATDATSFSGLPADTTPWLVVECVSEFSDYRLVADGQSESKVRDAEMPLRRRVVTGQQSIEAHSIGTAFCSTGGCQLAEMEVKQTRRGQANNSCPFDAAWHLFRMQSVGGGIDLDN